jgi:hypothetical protein
MLPSSIHGCIRTSAAGGSGASGLLSCRVSWSSLSALQDIPSLAGFAEASKIVTVCQHARTPTTPTTPSNPASLHVQAGPLGQPRYPTTPPLLRAPGLLSAIPTVPQEGTKQLIHTLIYHCINEGQARRPSVELWQHQALCTHPWDWFASHLAVRGLQTSRASSARGPSRGARACLKAITGSSAV